MNSLIVCMFVAAGASVASAQVIRAGKCDASIGPITDFEVTKYMGMWYEYARSFVINEAGSKCNTAYYKQNDDGSVALTNIQWYPLLQKRSQVLGNAAFDEGLNVARLTVTGSVPKPVQFSVLATDYENYAIIYGCSNLPLSHATTLWVLTRERFPSEEVVKKAYAAVESRGVDSSILNKTDHDDCAYTPLQLAFKNKE